MEAGKYRLLPTGESGTVPRHVLTGSDRTISRRIVIGQGRASESASTVCWDSLRRQGYDLQKLADLLHGDGFRVFERERGPEVARWVVSERFPDLNWE